MKIVRWFALGALMWTVPVHGALKTEVIEYKDGETALEGYLAFDTSFKGRRPGVLVAHEWWGLNAYAKKRADQLAKLGYVAFALDMYGKGVVAKTPQEAGQWAGKLKGDRKLMRTRVAAGLQVLKNHRLTDPRQLGAVGYCFGGTTVLELARGGSDPDLRGVVSFHGGLDFPDHPDLPKGLPKLLILHGGDDPFVKQEDIQMFQEELRKGGWEWQFHAYGGAVHAFTNPDAGNDPSKGAAYNEKADKRSWQAMKEFFAEVFPVKK